MSPCKGLHLQILGNILLLVGDHSTRLTGAIVFMTRFGKGDLEMEKGKSFHTLNLIDLKSPYATELFKILPSGVYYSTMSET